MMPDAVAAASARAATADVRLHDLRHTYASWLAQDGASMAAIRDLLGHSSLSVTSRYAHLARPDLEGVTKGLRVRRGSEDSDSPPEQGASNA